MRLSILFCTAIATLSINSCEDMGSAPASTSTGSVLMHTTFDNLGQPSLSGWQDGYPRYGLLKNTASFSNDVPPNGGQWSLKVFPPDTFYSVMCYVVHPVQPSQSNQFRLTYGYKSLLSSRCEVTLGAYGASNEYLTLATHDSITWKRDTLIFHSNNPTIDSVIVFIYMFTPRTKADTSKFILFNEFKLDEWRDWFAG
jgi:hypothetical protein